MSCGICLRSGGFWEYVLWLIWVGGWDREFWDDGIDVQPKASMVKRHVVGGRG